MDHIIIGDNEYFSFCEQDILYEKGREEQRQIYMELILVPAISKFSANTATRSSKKKIPLRLLTRISYMHMAMKHMLCMKKHRRISMYHSRLPAE